MSPESKPAPIKRKVSRKAKAKPPGRQGRPKVDPKDALNVDIKIRISPRMEQDLESKGLSPARLGNAFRDFLRSGGYDYFFLLDPERLKRIDEFLRGWKGYVRNHNQISWATNTVAMACREDRMEEVVKDLLVIRRELKKQSAKFEEFETAARKGILS